MRRSEPGWGVGVCSGEQFDALYEYTDESDDISEIHLQQITRDVFADAGAGRPVEEEGSTWSKQLGSQVLESYMVQRWSWTCCRATGPSV